MSKAAGTAQVFLQGSILLISKAAAAVAFDQVYQGGLYNNGNDDDTEDPCTRRRLGKG